MVCIYDKNIFTKKDYQSNTKRFFENKKKRLLMILEIIYSKIEFIILIGIIFLATSTSYKEINRLLETTKKAFKKPIK